MSRTAHLAAGRASTALWLRACRLPDPLLAREVRSTYNRLADEVPWPQQPVLRVHLAYSVLPGAALFTALRARGWDTDEAARVVRAGLMRMARPRRRALRTLTRSRAGRRLFMRAARGSLRAFPEPGWQATWVERSPDRVAFDFDRCFDLDMLRRLDAGPIAPGYCAVDDVLYAGTCPQLRWARTGTLATGADRCDFRFELTGD